MQDKQASILVVDDDESICYLIRDALLYRYSVQIAPDVIEGVDLLRAQRFDLLIIDLDLPIITGIEFISMLRADPDIRNIPILVISAFSDLIGEIQPQVQAVLSKPFSLQELETVVAQIIGSSFSPPPSVHD